MSVKKYNSGSVKDCPVSSQEIDVVPECYHNSNRCLCFLCTCGTHICPSSKKVYSAKGMFSSSYKRSYSKPLVSRGPQRVHADYHPNTGKMDFKTEYKKEFPEFPITANKDFRSETPQPSVKFEGKSQYHRDFPNWGPVDYHNTKRPTQPIHETKLKFQATSSYGHFYQAKTPEKKMPKHQETPIREKFFQVPLQSTSQREYKASSIDHFAKLEPKKIEKYVPVCYNPHQFRTTSRTTYLPTGNLFKDPTVYRREALQKSKFN